MSRRAIMLTAAGAAVVLALGLIAWQREWLARFGRAAWTDPEQPAEGTAGQPVADPGASWAAARPSDPGCRGGARVLRTYAPTLADDPGSVVR